MSRSTTRLAVIVWTLCATSACSKPRAETASAASAERSDASASAGADTAAVALDCGKVFSPDDAAGLLKAPVTVSKIPGGDWCSFGNDALSNITVRTGSDEDTEMMWDDATVSTNRTKFVALPGVGDQAVFKAGTRAEDPEVASKKGKVYCIVSIDGGAADGFKRLGGEELAKRLGALCNKVFAALRA